MFRKWNRILAFLLSLVLVTTTFGSDFATATAYAVEDGQELKERSGEEIFENANLDDLLDDENGEDVQKTSDDQKGEGKPAEGQQNVQNGDQPAESQQNDQQGDDEQLDETAQNPEELTSATDNNEEDEDETKEPEYEFEFNQSQVVNGIEVSLFAAPEVLPYGAVLSVEPVSEDEEEQIKELIDDETGKDVTVEKTISFDINIYLDDTLTETVQPKKGTVAVTFSSVEEVSEGDIDVYHVADDGESAEKVENVDVDVKEETVSFDASHFSTYTIVLKNGKSNRVSFKVKVVDDANNEIGADNEISREFEAGKTYTVDDIRSNVKGIDTNRYEYFETLVDTGRNNSPRWKKVDSFYADTYTEWFVFTGYRLRAVVGNDKYNVNDHTIRFVYMDKTATVPVAVYASDGTNSTRLNEGLRDKLNLYYVEANSPSGGGNGYYPVGVVNLPRALVYEDIATTGSDNKKIFTNDDGDMQNLRDALLEATWSTDQLKRDDNKRNTVLSRDNIDYIQFEASDAGSDMANHRTTLMSWPDWYNEEGLNGTYGYHLDLRFATNIVTFKGVKYEDGQPSGNIEDIATKGYLKDQTATVSDATETAQFFLPEGYSVSGLYTNSDCADNHRFTDTVLTQNATIYVKYSKVNTYHIRYHGGANGVTGSVPEQTYTYGDSAVTIQGNVGANGGQGFVRTNYQFTGWNTKADGTGTSYTPGVSRYNTAADLDLYAQWKPYTRINFSPKDVSKTYDGQSLAADYTVSGLDTTKYEIQGIGYSVSSITDVDDSTTYTITNTSNVKIVRKSDKQDVTDEFDIVISSDSATMTVYPAEIYIETAGDEKEYDGVALTKNEATVIGLKNNESASIQAVGSQLAVGYSSNDYAKNNDGNASISWGSNVKASNYSHNKQKDNLGTLKVNKNTSAQITISVPSYAKIYDGEAYSVDSSKVSFAVTTKDAAGKDVTLNNFSLRNVTLKEVGSNEAASTSISVQNAGSVTYQVADYKIVTNSNPDVDVKDNFQNISITNGTLTVYPKTVIFTSAGYGTPVTKTYDGSPLTSEEVTIEVPSKGAYDENGNPIAGTDKLETNTTHPFTATATGTVTYPDDGVNKDGKVTNTIAVTQPDATILGNYNIIKHEGTLQITSVPENEKETFTLKVGHAEGSYTGQPYTVTGFIPTEDSDSEDGTRFTWNGHVYKVDGLTVNASETDVKVKKAQDGKPIKTENGWEVDKYTVSATGIENAKIYAVEVVDGKETLRDVTSQFNTPEVLDGYIKIDPVPVTISSSTWTQTYDGKALNNATGLAKAKADNEIDENNNYGVTITGSFVNGEENKISYVFDASASQTIPGSTKNTFSVVWGDVKETNYNVELVPGDLIVENRNAKFKIKVVAGSKDFNYDGTDHSVGDFDKKFGNLLLINEENGETTESRLTYTENKDGSISFTLGEVNYVITELSIKTPSDSYKHVFKDPNTKEILPYTVSVVGTAVIKQEGFDTPVTDQFTVERGTGNLTINPRYVTVKSASYTKEYDGTPLNNQWLINKVDRFNADNVIEIVPTENIPEGRATGLVSGEEFVFYEVFGGQTNIGGEQNNNTFKIGVNIDTTRQDDYEITPEYGTLTVTGREKNYVINVKAASKLNEQYTGQPISVTDFDESDYRDVEVIKDENGNVTKLKYTAESGAVFYVTGLFVNTSEKDVNASRKNRRGNWIVEPYSVPVNGLNNVVVTDESGITVPSQSDIFTINPIAGELKINPLNVTLTSSTWEKEYDGEFLTNESAIAKEIAENPERAEELNKTQGVTAVGFVEGEGATYKNFTGKSLLAGKSADNTFEYVLKDGTEATNYNIHKTYGKLTVKNRTDKYKITVEANSGEVKYDGHSYYVSGFKTLNFTVDGHTYSVGHLSANSGIHSNVKRGADGEVEAYTSYITGRERVYDQYNNDVTGQFEVTKVPGTLTITPRQITLTSASDSREYNGIPLTKKIVTVSGDGFVFLQGVFVNVTGSQTIAGTSENDFIYVPWIGTLLSNYDITKVNGTLEVTNRNAPYKLTVIGKSDTVLYDGTEKTVSGFEAVKVNNGRVDRKYFTAADGTLYFMLNGKKFTVSGYDIPHASATDVVLDKKYENDVLVESSEKEAATASITGTPVVKDEDGKDVSAQFAVSTEAGKLIIKRRRVTIVAKNAEQEFNGNPLTCPDYDIVTGKDIDGFAVYTKNGATVNERDGVIITTSGSALRPKDSPATNHISVVFDGKIAKADNYIVTTVDGALTINSPSSKIMLDITLKVDGGNQKEVTYNGKQQSMDVTIGITPKNITETEETQTTTEGGNTETPSPITQNSDDNDEGDASDLSAMIGKLMSLGTITVYAAEGEDIFEDVEQLKYNSTATFTYGDTTFVVSGITLEGGAGTDVGKYPVSINLDNLKVFVGKVVDGVVVADESAQVNEFGFNVVKPETSAEGNDVVGVLKIVEKEITVTTGSASKDYDGDPLTSDVASIDGIVNGETYKITATGSRTEVGTSKNTYKIDWWAGEGSDYTAKETNYKIVEENLGDLRVDEAYSGGGGEDTPFFFTLAAAAPAGEVLGAQRAVGEAPAVLGARRSSTDDNTNSMARVFVMVAATALVVTMIITGKKKKEEEE